MRFAGIVHQRGGYKEGSIRAPRYMAYPVPSAAALPIAAFPTSSIISLLIPLRFLARFPDPFGILLCSSLHMDPKNLAKTDHHCALFYLSVFFISVSKKDRSESVEIELTFIL